MRKSRGGKAYVLYPHQHNSEDDVLCLCIPLVPSVDYSVVHRAVDRLQRRGVSGWLRLGTVLRGVVRDIAKRPQGRPAGTTSLHRRRHG